METLGTIKINGGVSNVCYDGGIVLLTYMELRELTDEEYEGRIVPMVIEQHNLATGEVMGRWNLPVLQDSHILLLSHNRISVTTGDRYQFTTMIMTLTVDGIIQSPRIDTDVRVYEDLLGSSPESKFFVRDENPFIAMYEYTEGSVRLLEYDIVSSLGRLTELLRGIREPLDGININYHPCDSRYSVVSLSSYEPYRLFIQATDEDSKIEITDYYLNGIPGSRMEMISRNIAVYESEIIRINPTDIVIQSMIEEWSFPHIIPMGKEGMISLLYTPEDDEPFELTVIKIYPTTVGLRTKKAL